MSASKRSASNPLKQIKTGSFERRLSLTRAGLMAGTRMAGEMTASLFSSKEKRAERRSQALSRQARYLVDELGKLKGSVVKIGQVMALYGEHFLPVEVTEALHTLEDNTVALEWPVIRGILYEQLGAARMAELEVEEEPIGTASLGQVHRARIKSNDELICLKVQYPGVAQAVDADLDAVAQILKLARLVSMGPAFDDWLEEVRVMMHREVDYVLEAQTTAHFAEMLADDPRYIVPVIYDRYSTAHVIATRYEPGEQLSSTRIASLSQERRNRLAKSALELFLNELFVWHEIQTDPNFGNYRIRIDEDGGHDQIVLLDFGAVQKYPESFIHPVCSMIAAAYQNDLQGVIDGGVALRFMQCDWPESVLKEFGQVCIAVLEPLAKEQPDAGPQAFNAQGEYCWRASDLPSRIAKRAAVSAISRYFKIPPKEFVFLNRKLVGVYTFISVLDGQFNGRDLLAGFVDRFQQGQLSATP
ncbi:MAG: AarF/ABC1/UbiB kinase family protein [Oleiphilaceae bacterium]|nr:AarF/ABC1/UbiB kinase family protein [Oleiphilaceae bacterium]